MNATRLNALLHSGIRSKYRVVVGSTVEVVLPRLPITADTEFVQLDLDTSASAPFEATVPDQGEGNALPDHLHAHALRPGSGVLRVTAIDVLTQEPIPNVEPLEIEVTVVGNT